MAPKPNSARQKAAVAQPGVLEQRHLLHAALTASLVKDRRDLDTFDLVFDRFFGLRPVVEEEDPLAELEAGRTPSLAELRLHNGTIYRWNRPVYDVVDDVPHLRVENRVLGAGPTVLVLTDGAGVDRVQGFTPPGWSCRVLDVAPTGARALQEKVRSTAQAYLSHGNAAVDADWTEF